MSQDYILHNSQPEPNSGCWLWLGCLNKGGYGAVSGHINRTTGIATAHRLSYSAFVGDVPSNLCVCHRCDTPACVNPSHLFLGTNLENIADRVKKGRTSRKPPRDPLALSRFMRANTDRQARGEYHGSAKITRNIAMQIRNSPLSLRALSEEFGISERSIYGIKKGETWSS